MAINFINNISIGVELMIMPYSKESYLKFNPDNPFIWNDYQPLPYWGLGNKFDSGVSNNGEVYWVVEEELIIDPPGLNLEKAFNCFNTIPSTGARYSLKLCLDLPHNKKPMALPPTTGSETGHTFVVVTKKSGAKTITQVFGFYAERHPGYLNPWRAMDSTIKNNQLREINGSIEMGLTEAQFQLLREKALELARQKYKAAGYNCTNFALDLFNSVRQKPIIIDSYTVYLPHNNNSWFIPTKPNRLEIDKTPQMLWKKLKEMKDNKDAEASRIVIDTSKNTKAPLSNGECN